MPVSLGEEGEILIDLCNRNRNKTILEKMVMCT